MYPPQHPHSCSNRGYSMNAPASPTHQELFTLTQKMREYELLCHRQSCHTFQDASRQSSRTAAHSRQRTVDSMVNDMRSRSGVCPYAFTTYPPPPSHAHLPTEGVETINEPNLYLFSILPEECASMHMTMRDEQETDLLEDICCCCCCTGSGTSSTQEYYQSIMQELRFITNRLRRDDELGDIIGEWKFAAIVIDRLCLIMFSTFAIISLGVCLMSAPHLIA